MYEVFTKLLNMSLTASILALIVIFLRFALKKAPKKFICVLWALVAVRLIFPFSISSSVSAYNVLHQNTISSGQVEYFEYNGKTEKPQLTFEVPALVNDDYSPDSMTVGTKTSGVHMPTVVYIWLAGVVIMISYAVASYAHLYKEVKASIKQDNNIFVCDEINSPFILGVIRPRIYLPSGISEEVRANVVAHEMAHIKRRDYLWKPLGFVLLSVYWFNPVMWVAFVFLCKDIEAACDEKVISQMDKDHIAGYSQALLLCASQRRMITACPIAFGETDVKGRIRNVLNYKKPAFWVICISVIACIAVAICFLTNPKGGDARLLDNASPSTSAMSLHYFDGEKTEVKWLYDEKEEQKIIDEINKLAAKKSDNSRISEFTTPCYGLEISDKDGYMIWLTYCNGLWLNKDGSVYEADYNFEKLYNNVFAESTEVMSGGAGMTNAGLLGEYDVRYYSVAKEMSSQKNGVELSIASIEGNTITVLIQNNSSEDFIYGTYYSLHKEIDGVWYVLPPKLSNYGFTDIGIVLPAGESREEQCDLTMYGELSDGYYRIEKEGMVAEFGVKDESIFYSSHSKDITPGTDERRSALDAYYQLIHAIETAMYDPGLIDKNPGNYKDSDGNDICSSEFFVHLYDGRDDIAYQNLGYTMLDLDGDDVPELLLGANDPAPDGTYKGVIYDLYCYKDGEIKHIFSGWPRNAYYLFEGSSEFVCVWSNSADDNGKTYYQYSDGELKKVVGLEKEHVIFQLRPMGPTWQQVEDLNGDGRADYIIYPYLDGFTNRVRLYLTGEGTVFEHSDGVGTGVGKIISAVDMDSDGEEEIVLTFEPHVNSLPLEEFAVLKKINGEWKELEQFVSESGNNSFPLKIVHDKDFKVQVSCDGLEKTITFDTRIFYEKWKEYGSEKEQKYYEELSILPAGTPVGRILDWGIWDISLSKYDGNICLVAEQGIASDNQEDMWGTVSIFFNYNPDGRINILDISFLSAAHEREDDESELTGLGIGSISYSEYTYEFIFNFGGQFFLSDDYEEPVHGEGTPEGWYALGGKGECIDPAYAEREKFEDGKLIEYTWLDNHSDNKMITPFSVGDYSCCLYRYSFDLLTVPELEQHPDADPTSEYWVIFYTEGEGKPLYIKYFNCDYFTKEQAMENIVPGLEIILES